LTGFSNLIKPLLLLLLLSNDYYKKALISIVAVDTILMNRIVFTFNARAINAVWDKYVWSVYTKMLILQK